jgi:hypothetical protein
MPAARSALALVERQLATLDQLATLGDAQREIEGRLRGAGGRLLEAARSGSLQAPSMESLLAMVYARYQKDLDAEKVAPDRRKILDGIFAELFSLMKTGDESVEEMQARLQKISTLMLRVNELMSAPSSTSFGEPASHRRKAVESELHHARTALFEQAKRRFKPSGETDRVQELTQRLLVAINDVRSADGDVAVGILERDVLRRLCLEIREFARRKHLTLARPMWSTEDVVRRTNAIFFSGGGTARAPVEAVAHVRGLEVVASPLDGMDPADSRWRQLRASNLGVFDYTSNSPDLATTSYELGIARALGIDVLIIARRGEVLPFDVEVDAVFDDEDLGTAVDRALYRPLGAETDDSVATFVESLQSAVGHASSVAAPAARLGGQTPEQGATLLSRHALRPVLGAAGARRRRRGLSEQRHNLRARRRSRWRAHHPLDLERDLPGHPRGGRHYRPQPERAARSGHDPHAGPSLPARRPDRLRRRQGTDTQSGEAARDAVPDW